MPDNHRLPRCWRVLGCPDTGVCTVREHTCTSDPDPGKEPEPELKELGRQLDFVVIGESVVTLPARTSAPSCTRRRPSIRDRTPIVYRGPPHGHRWRGGSPFSSCEIPI